MCCYLVQLSAARRVSCSSALQLTRCPAPNLPAGPHASARAHVGTSATPSWTGTPPAWRTPAACSPREQQACAWQVRDNEAPAALPASPAFGVQCAPALRDLTHSRLRPFSPCNNPMLALYPRAGAVFLTAPTGSPCEAATFEGVPPSLVDRIQVRMGACGEAARAQVVREGC